MSGVNEIRSSFLDYFKKAGHEVVDHGPKAYDPVDDYPSFCINAARGTVDDQNAGVDALGIVFGGSGNGEQIAANKVQGVRAALIWNSETAALARDHNDANVCALGARKHDQAEVLELVKIFISAPFSGDQRHIRRIGKISVFEQTGEVLY